MSPNKKKLKNLFLVIKLIASYLLILLTVLGGRPFLSARNYFLKIFLPTLHKMIGQCFQIIYTIIWKIFILLKQPPARASIRTFFLIGIVLVLVLTASGIDSVLELSIIQHYFPYIEKNGLPSLLKYLTEANAILFTWVMHLFIMFSVKNESFAQKLAKFFLLIGLLLIVFIDFYRY